MSARSCQEMSDLFDQMIESALEILDREASSTYLQSGTDWNCRDESHDSGGKPWLKIPCRDTLPQDHLTPARIRVEKLLLENGVPFKIGGRRAWYCFKRRQIMVPQRERFHDPDMFYATLLHETCHWALRRIPEGKLVPICWRFGNFGWARQTAEEITVESCSAMLLQEFGLKSKPVLRQQTLYIAAMLSRDLDLSREDLEACCTKAVQIRNYLLSRSPESGKP